MFVCFFSPGATFGCFAFNFPPRLAWDLALHLGEKGKKIRLWRKKKNRWAKRAEEVVWGGGRERVAPPLPFPLPQATAGLAGLADIFPNSPRFLPFSPTAEPSPRTRAIPRFVQCCETKAPPKNLRYNNSIKYVQGKKPLTPHFVFWQIQASSTKP